MRTITEDQPHPPARRRWIIRPGVLIPAGTAVLVGGLVLGAGQLVPGLGSTISSAGQSSTKSASGQAVAFLEQAASAAQKQSTPAAHSGQFIYLESVTTDTSVQGTVGQGKENKVIKTRGPKTRRQWLSLDGRRGWLIDPNVGDEPAQGQTLDYVPPSGTVLKDGKPVKLPVVKGALPDSYEVAAQLPHDPDALLAKIRAEAEGRGNSSDAEAFALVGDLLKARNPLPQLDAALYRATEKIPGVTLVDSAVDASGRKGVAIAHDSRGVRSEWIFDPKTHALLGFSEIQVTEQADSLVPVGTVLSNTSITRVAVVDREKQVPSK